MGRFLAESLKEITAFAFSLSDSLHYVILLGIVLFNFIKNMSPKMDTPNFHTCCKITKIVQTVKKIF